MAVYFDNRPLHLPAAEGIARRSLLDWKRFNQLLSAKSHWTRGNIELVLNSRAIQPEFYLDEAMTLDGVQRRANQKKVEVFLGMGASLVANNVHELSAELSATTSALGDQFSAKIGANAYCSFQRVQAFASHCDLHDVFAVQCEGEKVWNIYTNRALSPVAHVGGEDAQDLIDRAKGPLLMQVRMRPGDLLYIPRGFFHDALATSEASLHVTFSVTPLDGRALIQLLGEHLVEEEVFRRYLPDPREQSGAALQERLSELAERLSAIVKSKRFASGIAERQRQLWEPDYRLNLPDRPALEFFARGSQVSEVQRRAEGAWLCCASTQIELGPFERAVEWLLSRPAFSVQELVSRYHHLDEQELRDLLSRLEQAGIIYPYKPAL